MTDARTDDFRLEREGDTILVTFTPDRRRYAFTCVGGRLEEAGERPPRAPDGGGPESPSDADVAALARRLALRAL